MALIRCCWCRDPIQPVGGKWVGLLTGKPACLHAPDKRHARQIVFYARPTTKARKK